MSIDPYLDPRTGVLRNLLGITDAGELAAAESDFTAVRLAQLGRAAAHGGHRQGRPVLCA